MGGCMKKARMAMASGSRNRDRHRKHVLRPVTFASDAYISIRYGVPYVGGKTAVVRQQMWMEPDSYRTRFIMSGGVSVDCRYSKSVTPTRPRPLQHPWVAKDLYGSTGKTEDVRRKTVDGKRHDPCSIFDRVPLETMLETMLSTVHITAERVRLPQRNHHNYHCCLCDRGHCLFPTIFQPQSQSRPDAIQG